MKNKVIKEGSVIKNTFLGGIQRVNYKSVDAQQLCLENNNQMNWSIQEEDIGIGMEEESSENNQLNEKNQIALLRDIEIEKNIDSKVNSMYCNDYISSDKNNQEIFSKLIDEVFKKLKLSNSKKKAILTR